MKSLTPSGILLGIMLLVMAILSTVFIFNLRAQQPQATQQAIDTPK